MTPVVVGVYWGVAEVSVGVGIALVSDVHSASNTLAVRWGSWGRDQMWKKKKILKL